MVDRKTPGTKIPNGMSKLIAGEAISKFTANFAG